MAPDPIVVLENGSQLSFSLEDMLRYNGRGSPGGVAHAFKVLERTLPSLAPGGFLERRELLIETAFAGPGARDAFELVTRAVTDNRYVLDPSLARPEHGRARERFVFSLRYRDCAVTVALRSGFVVDEFVELVALRTRSGPQEQRLAVLKEEMAARVASAPAEAVYDVINPEGAPRSPRGSSPRA